MAISLINAASDGNGSSDHTDIVVPTGGWPIGTLVVVNATSFEFVSDVTNVADTRSNTYTDIPNAGGINGPDGLVRTYYSILTTALQAADLVTVTVASPFGCQGVAGAFSGIDATPLDQSANAREISGEFSPHSSGTVSTTEADELLIGTHLFRANGSITWTADNSFVVPTNGDIDHDGYVRSILQYRIVSATGSYDTQGTTSSSLSARNCISTFKAAAAPSTDTGLAWIRA